MRRDGRALDHDTLEAMRWRAIRAHRQGQTLAQIAKAFGLHWGSVSRWLTRYRRGGTAALRQRKATGRPPTLDCREHGPGIVKIVRQPAGRFGYQHPLWTCRRLQQTIRRALGIRISVPTMWRALKRLKLSSQKPERRAFEQDPAARRRWLRHEWPAIKRRAKRERALIFFEDESGIRLTPTVGKTWAPVGDTPIVRVTGKRACICVMSAVSVDGHLFFTIPKEKVNAQVFIAFLRGLLAEYPRRRVFVIADQARPHTAGVVRKFVHAQRRLDLFYLPPYSPDFNPDEKVWAHLKHHELKAHNARDRQALRRKTRCALRRMAKQPSLVRSFFWRAGIT
jgi:transposase